MCKVHSKVTHIKQQKYFHHLKGNGYNTHAVLNPYYIHSPLGDENSGFYIYICSFSTKFNLWF